MLVTQSCPTLCDPMDCIPPGSSVYEIFQTRKVERVAIPFSRGSSWPRDQTQVSSMAGGFFTIWATREAKVKVLAAQSCPTLCDPMDCSQPGSSVHGILQVRILEWVVHSLLQRIFPNLGLNLGLLPCRQILYHLSHQGIIGVDPNLPIYLHPIPLLVSICLFSTSVSLFPLWR